MATKFVSERNIKFLLYEVFDVESLTKYEYYNEHNRKMFTLRYFFAYELPKTLGLAKRLLDDDRMTVEMRADFFND